MEHVPQPDSSKQPHFVRPIPRITRVYDIIHQHTYDTHIYVYMYKHYNLRAVNISRVCVHIYLIVKHDSNQLRFLLNGFVCQEVRCVRQP